MELQYLNLGKEILDFGEFINGRNGNVKQLFSRQIKFNLEYNNFPIITTRKIFYKNILGEFAAFMNAPFNNVSHMKNFGVNYWDLWADKNTGYLKIDYGNEGERILNGNLDTQMSFIINTLKNRIHSRRLLLNYWNVDNIFDNNNPLSLPCCWYSIQFHIRDNKYLDLIWNQRSSDIAVGLPSDIVLAALYNIIIANNVELLPGVVTMNLGNCHLYEEHQSDFKIQTTRIPYKSPTYLLNLKPGSSYKDFRPEFLTLCDYKHYNSIKYLLKE